MYIIGRAEKMAEPHCSIPPRMGICEQAKVSAAAEPNDALARRLRHGKTSLGAIGEQSNNEKKADIDGKTLAIMKEFAQQFRSLRHYVPEGYSESFIRNLLVHSKHHSENIDEFRTMLECEYALRRKKHEAEVGLANL